MRSDDLDGPMSSRFWTFLVLALLLVVPTVPLASQAWAAPARTEGVATGPSSLGAQDLLAARESLSWSPGSLAPHLPQLPQLATPSHPQPAAGGAAGWTNITAAQVSSPPPRRNAAMAWDAADGYVLLFGGYATGTFYGDTWKFQSGQWTQLYPTGCSTCPSPRGMASMAYDTKDGYVVLFGGWSGPTYQNDTWKFVGGAWYPLTWATHAPSPREMAGMAYDPAGQYVVLFGGWDGVTDFGDTWRFLAGNWTQLLPPSSPSGRELAMMTEDVADNEVVLFGGCVKQCDTVAGLSDTWEFRGGSWTALAPRLVPTGRYQAAFADDPGDGYLLMNGGIGGVGATTTDLHDTWTFSGGEWTPLAPPTFPPARSGAVMAPESSNGGLVMFGGINSTISWYRNLQETWTWQDRPSVSPPTPSPISVAVGHVVDFTTAASGGSGIFPSYAWTESSPALGCTFTSSPTISCTPTAQGTTYTVSVNATDSIGVTSATVTSGPFTVTAPGTSALTGVTVTPTTFSMYEQAGATFVAQATCAGGPCPSGVVETWTFTPSLGVLNTTTGSVVSFTAGSTPGLVNLTVAASLGGVTQRAWAAITIASQSPSSPSPWQGIFNPLDPMTLFLLVLLVAIVLAVVGLLILQRRKKEKHLAPPPPAGPWAGPVGPGSPPYSPPS